MLCTWVRNNFRQSVALMLTFVRSTCYPGDAPFTGCCVGQGCCPSGQTCCGDKRCCAQPSSCGKDSDTRVLSCVRPTTSKAPVEFDANKNPEVSTCGFRLL